LNNLKDIQAKTLYLPLTEDGVFGKGLEKQLEKRKEQKEQLNDLLPEFTSNSISGYLVIQPEQVTHKLVEIEICLFDSESFSESNQESGCVDQIRQYRYDNVTLIPLVLSRRQ
jgi:hypothetical protein